MARNRKKAKERRARRPESVAAAQARRERSAPSPLAHAAPEVELAEAQLEVGRPDDVELPDDGAGVVDEADGAGVVDEADGAGVVDEADDGAGVVDEAADGAGVVDEADDGAGVVDEEAEEPEEDEFGSLDSEDPSTVVSRRGSTRGDGAARSHDGEALTVAAGRVPEHRPWVGGRFLNFLYGTWRELQRVQWPDRRQVIQATGVVIGFVIVAGLFLGGADWVAGQITNYILK